MKQDTYFLNANEALKVASEQNRWDGGYSLQVCYYEGEKIESDLPNLIHLPIDNLLEGLVYGRHRIPTMLDTSGLELSEDILLNIVSHFKETIQQATNYRNQINQQYIDELKVKQLDFNEPWRFYLMASDRTTVMQFVSKSIADTLRAKGYDVLFDLYNGTEDTGCHKNLFDFNPHCVININHLNNTFLSQDVFNFVWFQDPMEGLLDDTVFNTRKRDYIFSLVPVLDALLQKKGIESQRQSFCIDENIYRLHPEIQREKKIVFIGSAYRNPNYETDALSGLMDDIIEAFQKGESFTDSFTESLAQKHGIDKNYLHGRIIPYIVRDLSVLWLCSIKSEYKIEIYGWGWDAYESVKPFYKGVLGYGEEIAKVYNSATYAFAPHQNYVLQNRVLEAAACGAIPIVYDCRDVSDEPVYEQSMSYFKTQHDLLNILSKEVPTDRDFTAILEAHSYSNFVDKMLQIVKENLK